MSIDKVSHIIGTETFPRIGCDKKNQTGTSHARTRRMQRDCYIKNMRSYNDFVN